MSKDLTNNLFNAMGNQNKIITDSRARECVLQARIDELFLALEDQIDVNDKLEKQNQRLVKLVDPSDTGEY